MKVSAILLIRLVRLNSLKETTKQKKEDLKEEDDYGWNRIEGGEWITA